jgi:hypothetical protein
VRFGQHCCGIDRGSRVESNIIVGIRQQRVDVELLDLGTVGD